MDLYKNPNTGEIKNYNGWKQWAEKYYTALSYDEANRDISIVKYYNILLPKDWFERIQKMLKLQKMP